MSYILIDAGNSCLKLSVLDSADNLEIYFTILDYSDLYHNLMEQLSGFIVSDVIISNVNTEHLKCSNSVSCARYSRFW